MPRNGGRSLVQLYAAGVGGRCLQFCVLGLRVARWWRLWPAPASSSTRSARPCSAALKRNRAWLADLVLHAVGLGRIEVADLLLPGDPGPCVRSRATCLASSTCCFVVARVGQAPEVDTEVAVRADPGHGCSFSCTNARVTAAARSHEQQDKREPGGQPGTGRCPPARRLLRHEHQADDRQEAGAEDSGAPQRGGSLLGPDAFDVSAVEVGLDGPGSICGVAIAGGGEPPGTRCFGLADPAVGRPQLVLVERGQQRHAAVEVGVQVVEGGMWPAIAISRPTRIRVAPASLPGPMRPRRNSWPVSGLLRRASTSERLPCPSGAAVRGSCPPSAAPQCGPGSAIARADARGSPGRDRSELVGRRDPAVPWSSSAQAVVARSSRSPRAPGRGRPVGGLAARWYRARSFGLVGVLAGVSRASASSLGGQCRGRRGMALASTGGAWRKVEERCTCGGQPRPGRGVRVGGAVGQAQVGGAEDHHRLSEVVAWSLEPATRRSAVRSIRRPCGRGRATGGQQCLDFWASAR